MSRECAHQIGCGLFVVAHLPQRIPFHGFSVEEAFEIGQELGSGGGHGEKGKNEGSDWDVFGRCPHIREEGRGTLCEVTIFSREGGAPRGVFSPSAHEGCRLARGDRPTRTRDARASGVFRLLAFISSPFACKVLSISVLRVKASPLVCSRRFTHNRLKQRVLCVKASPCAPVFTVFGYFCLRSLRGGERCGG